MDNESLQPVSRMSRDVAKAAADLGSGEARFLVDAYYIAQEDRKRTTNQESALGKTGEPNSVLSWFADQNSVIEKQLARALDKYTQAHQMGSWMRSVVGIGPVIAAGLLAHIDIEKAPTAGHIWRYAGLDPSQQWVSAEKAKAWVKENGVDPQAASIAFNIKFETLYRMASTNAKGESIKMTADTLAKAICRRPWNEQLKVLCWKLGQSFMKFSNKEDCYYGHLYKQRKQYENDRNDRGDNRAEAARILATKNIGKTTDAYGHLSQGKLPPAQIDARARRYAVKFFLSHLQQRWYETHYGRPAPLPFAVAHLGHAHVVQPPH